MKMTKLLAVAILGGVACTGCAKDEKDTDSSTITTTTTSAPTTKPASPAMTTSTPAEPAATAVPDKDMTHVLTKDEAFYTASPAQAKKPDGTLKSGTKVVLLMPRGSYAQVMTADGKRVYTSTAALKPVGS